MEKYFHLLLFLCNVLISSSAILRTSPLLVRRIFFFSPFLSLPLFFAFRHFSIFKQIHLCGDASICRLKEDTLRVHGVHVVDTCLEHVSTTTPNAKYEVSWRMEFGNGCCGNRVLPLTCFRYLQWTASVFVM